MIGYYRGLKQRVNSLEKTLMLRKTRRQKEKGVAEDEMVREHHQLTGHEFEQTPGDGRGQRRLTCCSPWGCKESEYDLATEQQQQQIIGDWLSW